MPKEAVNMPIIAKNGSVAQRREPIRDVAWTQSQPSIVMETTARILFARLSLVRWALHHCKSTCRKLSSKPVSCAVHTRHQAMMSAASDHGLWSEARRIVI